MGRQILPPLEIIWFTIVASYHRPKGSPLPASTKQQVKCFFRKFDANGDGRLSFLELKTAFKKLGVKAPFWLALQAINRADENWDGHISEHELDALAEFVLERGISVPPSQNV